MDLEERYAVLKSKVVKRKNEFETLVQMLENETRWLTSLASTRFHLNKEKGLLLHSVTVAENSLEFRDCLAPEISNESFVIVGLFHDVGKVGMPGKPRYVAVQLCWDYVNNLNEESLQTLLAYNEEDVVNLRVLKRKLRVR